jgi:hypothetical protein
LRDVVPSGKLLVDDAPSALALDLMFELLRVDDVPFSPAFSLMYNSLTQCVAGQLLKKIIQTPCSQRFPERGSVKKSWEATAEVPNSPWYNIYQSKLLIKCNLEIGEDFRHLSRIKMIEY